ncbi:sulfurtransferase TusA family protein [Miniphocaeibacter halophilus]|uniref:Sulfurtransferase TusA family protein n=1 Tax=Miniphocaeibacter halophilus TaxID=2931922 RepID=A0AC61N0X6_9FIRM|nr:sulfurtransferase TusA family protein [Miniphocaeibacter halophilus]QQK08896.1 sulfurtransferase TusA family protein [Miniphocaeibacter halophilus]
MAKKEVDARGLSCPEPVILTMNAVKGNTDEIEVKVDTNIAKENVTRFLKGKKFKVEIKENKGEFSIKGKK